MRLGPALGLAGAMRIGLLWWGSYQDATSAVKYTDIDYTVFTDAARCIVEPTVTGCALASGPLAQHAPGFSLGDPYARVTYRYTPLLALLMIPNILVHPAFGKIVFSIADLVVGLLLYRLMRRRQATRSRAVLVVALVWLLNPIIANISTRGSAEAILGVLVVSTLACAESGRWDTAAAVFGLAVHFKIYPIIYGSSLLVALSRSTSSRLIGPLSVAHVRFGMISAATFVVLNVSMYAVWGWPFIEHTYLYHVNRLDHRHNFSPYFYPFYLASETAPSPALLSKWARHPLAAFLPQFALAIGSGLLFGHQDLAFAWLIQTVTFVTFNKVCTSQYFLWYLWLLPPALPLIDMSRKRAFVLTALWIAGQAVWLTQAYRLEMLAESVYFRVWMASVGWFASNCIVVCDVLAHYTGLTARNKVE